MARTLPFVHLMTCLHRQKNGIVCTGGLICVGYLLQWRPISGIYNCRLLSLLVNDSLCIFSAKPVLGWNTLDTAHILAQHPLIYDDHSLGTREQIDDLPSLELVDRDNIEVPIYTPDQYRIYRREPIFPENGKPYSVLADLSLMDGLFLDETDFEIDGAPTFADNATNGMRSRSPPVRVFP